MFFPRVGCHNIKSGVDLESSHLLSQDTSSQEGKPGESLLRSLPATRGSLRCPAQTLNPSKAPPLLCVTGSRRGRGRGGRPRPRSLKYPPLVPPHPLVRTQASSADAALHVTLAPSEHGVHLTVSAEFTPRSCPRAWRWPASVVRAEQWVTAPGLCLGLPCGRGPRTSSCGHETERGASGTRSVPARLRLPIGPWGAALEPSVWWPHRPWQR